jgi:ElaB/YqjD/DUF883 family membrane-anchored ribosome-binding protein
MPQEQSYEALLAQVKAIPSSEVEAPSIPVDVAAQEGSDLYEWANHDKAALRKAGLDWSLVKSLPDRVGALREAESRWLNERFAQSEARENWSKKCVEIEDLRSQLLHAFRYAYRDDRAVQSKIRLISRGSSHTDTIQDLNDLAVVGKENADELSKINFEMSMLDTATNLTHECTDLLAKAHGDKGYNEAKDIRDRAYTFLKKAVDTIRDAGQYVFWRDSERAVGYASDYFRRSSRSSEKEPTASSVL